MCCGKYEKNNEWWHHWLDTHLPVYNVGTQCTDVPFGIIHIQAGGMERAQKINAIDNNVRKITLNHCCRLYDWQIAAGFFS